MQQLEILEWLATVELAAQHRCLQENAKGRTTDITPSYEQNALWVLAIAAEMKQLQEIGTMDFETEDH